eukprot:1190386-Prorocentrum_minimum.AAC.1
MGSDSLRTKKRFSPGPTSRFFAFICEFMCRAGEFMDRAGEFNSPRGRTSTRCTLRSGSSRMNTSMLFCSTPTRGPSEAGVVAGVAGDAATNDAQRRTPSNAAPTTPSSPPSSSPSPSPGSGTSGEAERALSTLSTTELRLIAAEKAERKFPSEVAGERSPRRCGPQVGPLSSRAAVSAARRRASFASSSLVALWAARSTSAAFFAAAAASAASASAFTRSAISASTSSHSVAISRSNARRVA